MERTIAIVRNGKQPGTVGWVGEQAREIRIGETKAGRRGAWLYNAEGEQVEVLAWFGEYDAGEPSGLIQHGNEYESGAKHMYTDAGWSAIEKLIEIAKEELLRDEEEDVIFHVEISKKIATA